MEESLYITFKKSDYKQVTSLILFNFIINVTSFSGIFIVNVTEDRNCAIYLNKSLDYEKEESYQLDIELISLQGFINKDFSTTQITINVADVNDNKPYFIFPTVGNSEKYYAAISDNAPIASTVLQVKVMLSIVKTKVMHK